MLETNVPITDMTSNEVRDNYKHLQLVERAFRYLKADLEIRPLFHWKDSRVRGHVFVCFLAYLGEQQIRLALKNLEKGPTWQEVLSGLSAYRKVRIAGKPHLKSLNAGLTEDTTRWLGLWQVSPR